jgi:hypothetical protein|tara:strand:- start:276 stop:434 length:159 start_codon:yes stop_codon:yes gene_type:complete
MKKLTTKKPNVNNYINHDKLGKCKIIAAYSFGTLDVETKAGKFYRITGLSFI